MLGYAGIGFELAAKEFLAKGQMNEAFACFTNTALQLARLGEDNAALDKYKCAQWLVEQYDDSWQHTLVEAELFLWLNICDSLQDVGRNSEALGKYIWLQPKVRETDNPKSFIRLYLGLGNVCYNLGDFDRSLINYNKALAFLTSVIEHKFLYEARIKHGKCNVFLDGKQ